MEASTSQVTRSRGRLPGEIRTLLLERSVLQRADGSARWQQEGTAVLAAVHGPHQAAARREDPERTVVEVVFKPRSGQAGLTERLYEAILRQTLEAVVLCSAHPRTSVQVVIQVVQASGSLLACSLNAACLALADAGVPLSSLFTAVALAHTPEGALLADPDETEEAAALGVVTLAYPHHMRLVPTGDGDAGAGASGALAASQRPELTVGEGLLVCHTAGRCSVEQYAAALEAGAQGCRGLAEFVRRALAQQDAG